MDVDNCLLECNAFQCQQSTWNCHAASTGAAATSCFASSSEVVLQNGGKKLISDVIVGDVILTMSLDNSFVFANVVFVPHKLNSQEALFLELQINNNHRLTLTESHLLLIQKQCDVDSSLLPSSFVLTRADRVALNDCVLTVTGRQVITSVELTVRHGIYTAVTDNPSGLLVVDGIVASSFSDFHFLANRFYHLHRSVFFCVNM